MDIGEQIRSGDEAEFGRLLRILGSLYLGGIITASRDEEGVLQHNTFDLELAGVVITTQPEGIAFQLGSNSPVSMELERVESLLNEAR